MNALLNHASQAYALSYFGVVIVVVLLECVVPCRAAADTLPLRWFGNIAITILDTVLVRILFPVAGIAWAVVCSQRGWGLFNQVAWPSWMEFVLTIVLLDLFYYSQHYLLHRVGFLWRLHRTHHSDHEYDVTTGLRFHPLEMTYTTALLLATLLILGASPAAVLVSQVMTTSVNFYEHANVRLPPWLDRMVRVLFVTPDMHRIHHSAAPGESRSNFANTFSWWDRLFGTYVEQPAAGQADMSFGIEGFGDRRHLTLPWMLAQPFLPDGTAAPPHGLQVTGLTETRRRPPAPTRGLQQID
jgi:sterol desaturase/sphingolipid hydroxylase (fatty acid hydroxylase superfamily)